MSDGDVLLRAILAEPDCDIPRLLYADWLEEHGDDSGRLRAEFVRVQVALARIPFEVDTGGEFWGSLSLHGRERELLTPWHFWAWFEVPGWPGSPEAVVKAPEVRVGYGTGGGRPPWTLTTRRGFIEKVILPAASWLEHGPALCSMHPVTEVRLAGKEPNEVAGECWWCDADAVPDDGPDPRTLPAALFPAIPGARVGFGHCFSSQPEALAALSRACVAYGREKAGLPPLPPSELKSERA